MRRTIKGIIYEDRVGPSNSKILIESELRRLYPGKKTLVVTDKSGWYLGLVKIGEAKTHPRYSLVDEMRDKEVKMGMAAARFHDSILPKTIPAGVYALAILEEWGPKTTAKKAFKQVFGEHKNPKLKVAFMNTAAGTVGVAYTGELTPTAKQYILDWVE